MNAVTRPPTIPSFMPPSMLNRPRYQLLQPGPHQLPTEIWKKVIDLIAGCTDWGDWTPVETLCACSLTCSSWTLRCRFRLVEDILIRSSALLYAIVDRLTVATGAGRIPAERVRRLTIDGGGRQNIFWVSVVRACLGPLLKNVEELVVWGVILDLVHPRFFTTMTLLTRVPRLGLRNIFFSRFSQFIHLLCRRQSRRSKDQRSTGTLRLSKG